MKFNFSLNSLTINLTTIAVLTLGAGIASLTNSAFAEGATAPEAAKPAPIIVAPTCGSGCSHGTRPTGGWGPVVADAEQAKPAPIIVAPACGSSCGHGTRPTGGWGPVVAEAEQTKPEPMIVAPMCGGACSHSGGRGGWGIVVA
jgi:hypothetical protein